MVLTIVVIEKFVGPWLVLHAIVPFSSHNKFTSAKDCFVIGEKLRN